MLRVCKALQANAGKTAFLSTQRHSGAREWGRTITALRPPDFESGASASSATRARRENITEIAGLFISNGVCFSR